MTDADQTASPADLFSIAGKTALVTGGTSGIGLMIARAYAERGVKVYIVARSADDCASVAAELSQVGTCIGLPGDLSSMVGIEAIAAALRQKAERLDILVNCAGINKVGPIDDFPEESWDQVMDLNLKAVFFLTQKLLPLLRAAGSPGAPATVINISSTGALKVYPGENYPYGASKAGLQYLTRQMAFRLAPENIAVNAIAPGFFPSKMSRPSPERIADVLTRIPMRRIGTEADMGGLCVFLASPAGSFLCGTIIPLDGGATV